MRCPTPPRLRLAAPVGAVVASLAVPAAANAHGLVGRRDLPIPDWLVAWAASTILVVSFVGLAALWRTARLARSKERRIGRVSSWLEIPIGLLGIALLVLTVVSGLAGIQIDTANFAPTAVFVGLWLLVPFSSLLVGDVWAVLNPIRAIGRGTGWLAGRIAPGRLPEPLAWPAALGRWPAAFGLLAFVWVELAFPGRGDPSQLAWVAVLYVFVSCIGMSLYGVSQWVRNADPFAVWFGWIATIAPLRWERGVVHLRWPGVGTAQTAPSTGDVGVIIVAIGTTAWDGLSGGAALGTWTADRTIALTEAGLAPGAAGMVVGTIGLLLTCGLVALLLWLGARGMVPGKVRAAARRAREAGSAASGPPSTAALMRSFAPTAVPIAVAYAVGHYLSLLAFQGQALLPLLSNPLGRELPPGDGGWLGAATWTIDYSWLSANAIWYLQAIALIAGHVLAVVLAHDRALERFPARRAVRSQRAMLVIAVIFTCTGLWLLSSV